MNTSYYQSQGVGRRKESTARVYLKEGKKEIKVRTKKGEKNISEYFYMQPSLYLNIYRLLEVFENYYLVIRVNGGGFHAQAEAIKRAIAKALLKISPDYRSSLGDALSQKNPRVERKKIGHRKARKSEQYRKR